MNKIAAWVVIGAVILIALVFLAMKFLIPPSAPVQTTNANSTIRIGFLLGTLQEERWAKDRDFFMAAATILASSVPVPQSPAMLIFTRSSSG